MRLSRRMCRGRKTVLLTFVVAGLAIISVFSSLHPLWASSPPVRREPQRDVFFLKTHKTAGSSVLNLLLRRAESEGLNLALPREVEKHLMGYPQTFSPQKHLLNYSQCGLRPNLMALHMRYNETGVKEVMPPGTVYVTIMRRPTDLFASLFYYFMFDNIYDANLTDFLREPFFVQTVRNARLHESLGFNQMAFDLGVDGDDLAGRGSDDEVSRFVQSVDRDFHLVMIAERFTESVVLLRELLGWQLDDMVAFKHNVRVHRYPPPAEDAVRILEKANRVDEALYRHFAAKLDRQVEAFGRGRMEAEAATLESRTDFWYRRCVGSTEFRQEEAVIEYTMRANVSQGEHRMCQLLTTPEQAFVKRARTRLFALCPQASPAATTTTTTVAASSRPDRGPR
ncbi:galactose-3-O-sulfotransferase 3-like [Dermacentor variabilis]|uniref:galactose-3-O-sulfotransferase 3-like n=1 Tax=Dermacentor variabilis TaxID=34621 RepID=UPI003F5CB634